MTALPLDDDPADARPDALDRETTMPDSERRTRPPVPRCPSCGVLLGAPIPARCPACAVSVGGDTGRRLLAIDQSIATLAARRADLLDRLRREARAPEAPRVPASSAAGAAPAISAERPSRRRRTGVVRRWFAAAGPQTLLAAGGVLLLAIAAVVFTAVAWDDLPMAARAAVILVAAVGSGRLTGALIRRELRRTAEATGVLTIALLAVLCNGLWRGGLLDPLGRGPAVLAVSAAVLALVAHGLARLTRTGSPLVLAAWLGGTAVSAGGVWLTGVDVATEVGDLDVLLLGAVDLVAVVVLGGYATRWLTCVPRWRVVTLAGAGVLWSRTAVGSAVVLAALSPATRPDVVPFLLGAVVAVLTVVVAAVARRITGPLASRWPQVGTGAMWFAGTLCLAGALSGRLGAWPDMALVVALTAGAVALGRCRTASVRLSAVVGMAPLLLAAAVPVGRTALWASDGTGGVAPDVVRLASVVTIAVVMTWLAVRVEGARRLLVGGAAASWLVAVVAAGVGAAALAPSDPDQLPAFLAHAGLLVVLVGLVIRPTSTSTPRPVASAALTFAVTTGATGLLWDRLAVWPQLPIVVALALGAALVRRQTRAPDQLGAIAGASPVLLAAMAIVGVVVEWVAVVLAERVRHPWPADVTTVPAPPDAAVLATAVAVCAIGVGLAVVVRRVDVAAGGLVVVGTPVLVAVGAAAWPVAGGASAGLVVVAVAVGALRTSPDHPAPPVVVAVASIGTAAAALTAPWVTIAALAGVAAATAVALPVRVRRVAVTVGWLLAADVVGLGAAVAATIDRDPAPVGVTIVSVATVCWLVAAAVRRDHSHALGIEVAATVAFVLGVPLAGTGGALWLGVAFAVLAGASSAVTVWRRDRRWMQWVAAASATAASWSILVDARVETVEAYTAPPALLLIVLAAVRLRVRRDVSSWPVLGSGLGLLTMPTVVQLTDDPGDLTRLLAAVALGAALVVAGRAWALQSPLVIGVTSCMVAALTQHAVVTDIVPRWLLLAVGGALLLWLSISYEAQRRRLTVAHRRLVAMR